jgi:6-pyruvoyltetrahydropterin/6-carboxytetrahydropterin synthase
MHRLFIFLYLSSSLVYGDKAFRLGIRDSFMVAHSFHGNPKFGVASGMHGATYTCDVEFCSDALDPSANWVIDIGQASEILSIVLSRYNFRNLDELFGDELTTTEFMCRQVYRDMCDHLREKCPSFKGDLIVKLWESHRAWASYKGAV